MFCCFSKLISPLFIICSIISLTHVFIPLSYATDKSDITSIPIRNTGGVAKNSTPIQSPTPDQNNPEQKVVSYQEVLAPGVQALDAYKEGALGNDIENLRQEHTNLL